MLIAPSCGGRGTGDLTAYSAQCVCGLLEDHFSVDGSMRSAVSGWNKWAREQVASGVKKTYSPAVLGSFKETMGSHQAAKLGSMVENDIHPSPDDVLRDSGQIEISFRFCRDATVDAFASINDYHKACGIGKPTALEAAKVALDRLFATS